MSVTRHRLRRASVAVCVIAVLWAIVLALTSGISVSLGPIRLSSHSPRGPLVLAIVAGLAAWVLAMPVGAVAAAAPAAPRRARAIALIGLMILGLNVLMLGQPPMPTDRDYCMSDNVIGKRFRHILNCDSHLFMILAKEPSAVLTQVVWQSRPLAFGIPSVVAQPLYLVPRLEKYGPYRPYAPEFVAYLVVHLALLILAAVAFAWLLNGTTSLASSPELLFGVVALGVNDITKIFFWTPHLQIYNLFVPCLTMYLLGRQVQRGAPLSVRQAAALGLGLGLGVLAYGSFLIPVLSTAAVQLVRYRRMLPPMLIVGVSLAIYAAWVGIVVVLTGTFYSHEIRQYRQFVWLLDCAALEAGVCAPIIVHNLMTFVDTAAQVVLVPLALLFGLRVARSIWVRSDTPFETMPQPIAVAVGTTLLITTVFLALMGFYAPRLVWLLVPPLVLAIALDIRAWRLATPRIAWGYFNWTVLAVCLLYLGVLVARQGPYN